MERKKEQEKFEKKVLEIRRVTRVVAGGKRLSFRAVVVVGDKMGHVGFGVGKANDVSVAVEKATKQAQKKLITVPIVNDTILHEVKAKYKAAKVWLAPAKKGKGFIVGGAPRVICELAGIQNIVGKILGKSKSKINNVRATLLAFKQLKNYKE